MTLAVNDGMAILRLGREHGNAINGRLVDDLAACVKEAALDRSVRGALLAASGKLFCPGLDLQDLTALDRREMTDFLHRFNACVLDLFLFPKPLVAAIHGPALAGGCVLAMTADWRLLRRGVPVGLNEIRVGVPLPWGVSHLLRETVNRAKLEEIALVGRNYTDAEAVAAGLVHEVLDERGFEESSLQRLDEMARREPQAFSVTKRYLRSGAAERIRAGDALFASEFLDVWFSPGTRARVAEIVAGLKRRAS